MNNASKLLMKYMGLIGSCEEWCILEQSYFACNLTTNKQWICRLSYLKEHTPIKRDDTLIMFLNRLADKGWFKKVPFGKPIKVRGSAELKQRYEYIADQRTIENKMESLIKSPTENVGVSDIEESYGKRRTSPTENVGLSPTESVGEVLRKTEDIDHIDHFKVDLKDDRETTNPIDLDWQTLDFRNLDSISGLPDTKAGRCLIEIVKKRKQLAKEHEWPDSLTYDRNIIVRDVLVAINKHSNLIVK